MTRKIQRIPVAVSFILMAMAMIACGTANSSGGSESISASAKPKKGSMEACLLAAGAKKAVNRSQLAFLERAEDENEVDKPGLVFDKVTKTVVRLWETKASENRPPDWAVWFGQPFESDLEPLEIVDEHPAESFVVFAENPSRKKWKHFNQCPGNPKAA